MRKNSFAFAGEQEIRRQLLTGVPDRGLTQRLAHCTRRTRMTMNIYVGNLPYTVREPELRAAFEPFGAVSSVKVVIDRETDRSKGFGFVEMPDHAEGEAAIKALDGSSLNGRPLRVNPARPREDQGPRDRPRSPRY